MRGVGHRGGNAKHVRCGESITRSPHDCPMAYEIVEISLTSGNQNIVRTQRVPFGSSFSDLGAAIQTAMGWNGGEPHVFRIPGAGAEIDDESIPMNAYGRLPIEYVYGGLVHRIRFLGASKRDFSGSWFSDRRSAARSETVRGCVKRWYSEMSASRHLDARSLDRVADAIASSRKKDLYLDTKTLKIADSPSEEGSVLVRGKDSDFRLRTATSFAEGTPSIKRPDGSRQDWYQKFVGDVSRSSKASKAWSDRLRAESRRAAESWADDNGFLTDGCDEKTAVLPCMICGEDREAVEDRTAGGPAMMGRPRYPMVVRCPECRAASMLYMFNDGFVADYCFRKDSHPCWMARDAIRARRRAVSESEPGKRAELLLLAALEHYRCDKSAEARELVDEAAEALPDESKAVSSFIECEGAPDVGDVGAMFRPVLLCAKLRSIDDPKRSAAIMEEMGTCLQESCLPEWLQWELRWSTFLLPSNENDAASSFARMKSILAAYLERLSAMEKPSSDDYRRLCRMFETAVRFAFDDISFEATGPVISMMCDAFDSGRISNVPSRAVTLFRRGLYRMIVEEDDDGAVQDLADVVATMFSDEGRGPVTGRRAFAAMSILYMYDPDSMDLVSLALNSMNAMSVTGAFQEEELQEMEQAISRILKAVGGYEEARMEVRSRTNIELGPEPAGELSLEDLMDIRCSYYLERCSVRARSIV